MPSDDMPESKANGRCLGEEGKMRSIFRNAFREKRKGEKMDLGYQFVATAFLIQLVWACGAIILGKVWFDKLGK